MCPCLQPPWALALQEAKGLGPSVVCLRPPVCSVAGMHGDVGLKMDTHGRSRLPAVLVQTGLRQYGQEGSWDGNDSARREDYGLCLVKQALQNVAWRRGI